MRLSAAILLALLSSAIVIDPWCCPDGCTADVGHAAPSANDEGAGDCILCLGGIEAPADQRRTPRLVAREISFRHRPLFVDIVLPPAERPPR